MEENLMCDSVLPVSVGEADGIPVAHSARRWESHVKQAQSPRKRATYGCVARYAARLRGLATNASPFPPPYAVGYSYVARFTG